MSKFCLLHWLFFQYSFFIFSLTFRVNSRRQTLKRERQQQQQKTTNQLCCHFFSSIINQFRLSFSLTFSLFFSRFQTCVLEILPTFSVSDSFITLLYACVCVFHENIHFVTYDKSQKQTQGKVTKKVNRLTKHGIFFTLQIE